MTTFWLHAAPGIGAGLGFLLFSLLLVGRPRWLTWCWWFPPPVKADELRAVTRRSFIPRSIIEMDTRLMTCPDCYGAGGFDQPAGFDRHTGAVMTYWSRCELCRGAGRIEVPVEPIGMDDLDGEQSR